MKTSIARLALLGVAPLVLAACSTRSTPPEGPSRAYHLSQNLPSSGLALEGYCPVAYHAVNEPVYGSPEFSADHQGATYWFVNEEAREAFVAEPERYAPAYGGWCAFGMAVEDKFPVDPTQFKIVDGRLMLFLKNPSVDALDLWNQGNEAELVAKADAHWRTVRP